jgi:two-component system chemotaxis response regulator CheV
MGYAVWLRPKYQPFISFLTGALMSSQPKQLQKLLLFQLTDHRQFGLGTLKIREIMPFRRLSRLPHSHHAIVGTATFRDAAVPVIDMAAAIGIRR